MYRREGRERERERKKRRKGVRVRKNGFFCLNWEFNSALQAL